MEAINLYSIPPLIAFFLLMLLSFLIVKSSKNSWFNILFALACLSAAIWLFSDFMAFNSKEIKDAFFWFKIAYIGITFIPIFFFHYTQIFLGIKRSKAFVIINYIIGIWLLISALQSNLLIKENKIYFWGYYPLAGILHPFFVLFFFCVACTLFIQLIIFCLKTKFKGISIRVQQAKYILIAFILFTFAFVDFLPNYGINIYPFGYLPTVLFTTIITYAIVRYRLMDITVAITRTSIFVIVYSLVLGIPFALAFGFQEKLILLLGINWWLVPLILSTFLATAGPFIYLFIQRRAEDRLLREQRRYQATLRQASIGMTRIRDLNKLLNLIVHIITRTVRLKHSSIYLLNKRTNQFELRAIRDKGRLKGGFSPPSSRNGIGTSEGFAPEYQPYRLNFNSNSALVWNLILEKEPLVYEEVKQKMQDYKDDKLALLEQELRMIDAAVVVPSFVEEKLLGFIVLGEKLSGKIYSQDDLSVFSVLANQSALAIENAEFYEDIKETQTQLFHAEKMATIGTMADGLSHQINNRFHALGMISADALDALKSINESSTPEQVREVYAHLNHAFERVIENVKQGGEVVHSLLKYSRAGEAGFEPVDLDTLLNSSLEMVQYKVKLSQIDFFRDYPKDLPKIKGNFTQLQEVFFNFIDNAYDAINQRKNELNEPDYRGNVTIQAAAQDSKIQIRFIDNGMGVKEAEKERLFTPFFTTKTSSKKGTGLGLYVIQKIIVDNHKGKIFVESEYKTGTMFTIELPIAG